jgi:dienelactone hydrolase
MRIILLLFIAIFSGSCGPQSQSLSLKSAKKTAPQQTPVFYPKTKGPFPAILLMPPAVHSIAAENSIAGKLAAEGYVARAVNYGDTTFNGMFNDTARLNSLKQLAAESMASLITQPNVDPNRIGIIGYSLGGFFVTYLASKSDEAGLRAGGIYYGTFDVPDVIKNLRIPILAFQGEADQMTEFIHNALAMKQLAQDYHKQFDLVLYPRALHGFDRMVARPYDQAVAKNSWDRMIDFLNQHVKQAHP